MRPWQKRHKSQLKVILPVQIHDILGKKSNIIDHEHIK